MPPTNSTSTSSTADWLSWAKFFKDLYDSKKKGSFKPVPQTPEQADLYRFSRNAVGNLPDVNNAVFPLALANASSSPALDMDKLRRGEPGAYTAPQRMSTEQFASILKGNNVNLGGGTTSNGSFQNPDGTPNIGALNFKSGGGSGGSGRRVENRTMDMPDIYGNWGGSGPREGESIYGYLDRNPSGRPGDYLPNGGQGNTGPYAHDSGDPVNDALNASNTAALQGWLSANGHEPDFWDRVKQLAGSLSDDVRAAVMGFVQGGPLTAAAAVGLNLIRNYWTTGKWNP